MEPCSRSPLSKWLAAPTRVHGLSDLAQGWRDVECRILLGPIGPADSAFGAHLRRSFLAALAPSASEQARAGKPCPWDPPCALDVFLREQLRHGGDGLPKPYVLFWQQDKQVMQVTLRMFGTACDWGITAADALVSAMGALPWSKALHCMPPQIQNRQIAAAPWNDLPDRPLTLRLMSPMDDEGSKATDTRDVAARLLSRALRRVDAMARWQGLALSDAALSELTEQTRAVAATAIRLRPGLHISPNNKSEKRRSKVIVGEVDLPPLTEDLRLLLSIAMRCHIGRHTNEGLGNISVVECKSCKRWLDSTSILA